MIFDFFKRRPKPGPEPYIRRQSRPQSQPDLHDTPPLPPVPSGSVSNTLDVRRFFHNHSNFQCYTTWFSLWGGWASAGHCITDAQGHTADFAKGSLIDWPDGLDAALVGITRPEIAPAKPYVGQAVQLRGFPAGSRHMEVRDGTVYHERSPGQWIVHIKDPDEPVVVGMSGGPVIDVATGNPIGILITRNSPADLNRDRDPDESADFIALADIWAALGKRKDSPHTV